MVEKRSRRSKRSAAVLIGAPLVALAVTLIFLRLNNNGRQSQERRTPFFGHLVVAGRIRIPGGFVNVAAGEGSVWVTGFGVVTRVDPSTNRVAAEIAAPGTGDYSHVAVGYGGVWVTAPERRPGVLFRIDPKTNRIEAAIEIEGPVHDLELFNGYVWVTRPDSGRPTLFAVDPETNRLAGRYDPADPAAPPTPAPTGSVRGFGSAWLAYDDEVLRTDPESAKIQARILVAAADIAIGPDGVWVMTDTPSSSPDLYIPIPGRPGKILLIDPRTNRIASSPVLFGYGPAAMAVADDSLWVGEYGSEVLTHIKVEASQPVRLRSDSCGRSAVLVLSRLEAHSIHDQGRVVIDQLNLGDASLAQPFPFIG